MFRAHHKPTCYIYINIYIRKHETCKTAAHTHTLKVCVDGRHSDPAGRSDWDWFAGRHATVHLLSAVFVQWLGVQGEAEGVYRGSGSLHKRGRKKEHVNLPRREKRGRREGWKLKQSLCLLCRCCCVCTSANAGRERRHCVCDRLQAELMALTK